MTDNDLVFFIVVGATVLETLGIVQWCRIQSRPTWRLPVKVAKPTAGRMTSDSDFAGLY